MRTLRLGDDCDRGMLWPQPTKWVRGYEETIEALTTQKWDEMAIWDGTGLEEISVFLRDHPEYCPPRIVMGWSKNPLLEVKIRIWLTGVCNWDE